MVTDSCCTARSTAPTTSPPARDPDWRYAKLVGGPLDGLLLDITGWTQDKVGTAPRSPQSWVRCQRPRHVRPVPR